MNIYHKTLMAICVTTIVCGQTWSKDNSIIIYDDADIESSCVKAQYGKLNLDLVEYHNPSYYSYLFICSISVVVPYVDENHNSIMKRNKKKLKLANLLLNKELDIGYNDQYASTLLMSVVDSYMPKEWKLKTVKLLIAKGSDLQAKNIYGYTAMDSAKYVKDTEIIKILSNNTK